jgi:ribosomal protein L29
MSTFHSTIELKRMSPDELRKEIYVRRAECAKMRIGLRTQSEKDHALYRRKRREIARMLTVLGGMPEAPVTKKEISASQKTPTSVKSSGAAEKKPRRKTS